MKQYPFIFSDKKRYRVLRHAAFWACWWLFCTLLYAYAPYLQAMPDFKRLPITAAESACFLSLHIFLAYSLIYFVVPRLLLKEKYLATCISVVCLFIAVGLMNALLTKYFLNDIRNFILLTVFRLHAYSGKQTEYYSFHLALMAGLRGGITIGGMAAAIKLMKYWYIKEQRNLQLQKENAAIHLQLLKAQVHPHFLFNTLNNIYSFTQVTAPGAARLVTGLSDMLRYMLYDGNKSFVPLQKELAMVEQYIRLEQIRYEHLDVTIELPQDTGRLAIAPLLLLPLAENCFKHGTSTMLEQPWIGLYVSLRGVELNVKLVNGKSGEKRSGENETGIGIANVRKRLELLYPGQHQFKITDDDDVFVADLQLQLHEMAETSLPKEKELLYA